MVSTGDVVTDERIRSGILADVIGWEKVVAIFDDEITLRTIQRWDAQGLLPLFNLGPRKVAGYRDRIIAAVQRIHARVRRARAAAAVAA